MRGCNCARKVIARVDVNIYTRVTEGEHCYAPVAIHTPHNVAGGDGEDSRAAPDAVKISYGTKGKSYEGDVRLILALRRKEPHADGEQDTDDEADEDGVTVFLISHNQWSSSS